MHPYVCYKTTIERSAYIVQLDYVFTSSSSSSSAIRTTIARAIPKVLQLKSPEFNCMAARSPFTPQVKVRMRVFAIKVRLQMPAAGRPTSAHAILRHVPHLNARAIAILYKCYHPLLGYINTENLLLSARTFALIEALVVHIYYIYILPHRSIRVARSIASYFINNASTRSATTLKHSTYICTKVEAFSRSVYLHCTCMLFIRFIAIAITVVVRRAK